MTATVAADPAEAGLVEVVPGRDPLVTRLRNAWHHRSAVAGLAAEAFRTGVPRSALGFWWIPITIVFSTVAAAFVFGSILSVPSAPGVPYLVFLTVGMMAWWGFSRGALFSMRSFRRFARQVTVLRLPVALVPLAALAQVIGELAFYAVFLAVIIAAYGIADGELYLNASPELLLAPVALVWILAIAGSVGLFTAYPFYHARDIRFVYRLVLPFWLFVTPVVYSLESVEGIPGVVARLNPLAAPLELFKLGVLGIGDLPLYSVLVSIAMTALVLTAGLTLASRFGTQLASATPDDGDVLEDEI